MIFNFLRCSLTVLLSNTKPASVTVMLHICLFEIPGQILWLIHCRESFGQNTKAKSVTVTPEQRFICLNVWKLYSAIFDFKVKFLNKTFCSVNCGWLKETFWQYVNDYIYGLDKYHTKFQNLKRVLHKNKAHTKIS